MENMKIKAMMMAFGAGMFLGYKYMKENPNTAKAIKNMAKDCCKKTYQMLDDMN